MADFSNELFGTPEKLSATDVAGGFVRNFIPSVVQQGKNIVEMVTSPVQTAKGIRDVGLGVLQKVRELSPEGQRGSLPAFDTSAADAVGKSLVDSYGSLENVKRTLATDPAKLLADASLIVTGGGSVASRLPGMVGRVGADVAAVGQAIDPLVAALRATKAVAKKAEPVVSTALGFTTGAGTEAVRQAATSGYQGGQKADKFQAQMRGTEPVNTVVEEIKPAIEKLREERSTAYKEGMVDIKNDSTILSFEPIDNAISEVKNRGVFKNKVIDESAADTWQKINKKVSDWKNDNPAEYHTPEGMDALKKAIGDIRDSSDFGTPARNAADQVYKAIKTEIQSQAPTYSKVMKDYEEASSLLKEIEKTLSANPKANIDTTVRKLQSILRNNANTNYGRRVELGNLLEEKGATNLMPQLAGQALSSAAPRGLQGIGSAVAGATTAFANPAYLAALPLTSPRVVGEAAYYAGKGTNKATQLADKLKQYTQQAGIDPTKARMLAYQLSKIPKPTETDLDELLKQYQ
jgi:hypothetical protein